MGRRPEEADAAQQHVGVAQQLLWQLKNLMKGGGLQTLSRHVDLPDGSRVHVASVFGQDFVAIYPSVAAIAAAAKSELKVPAETRRVRTTKVPTTYLIGGKHAGLPAVWSEHGRVALPRGVATAGEVYRLSENGLVALGWLRYAGSSTQYVTWWGRSNTNSDDWGIQTTPFVYSHVAATLYTLVDAQLTAVPRPTFALLDPPEITLRVAYQQGRQFQTSPGGVARNVLKKLCIECTMSDFVGDSVLTITTADNITYTVVTDSIEDEVDRWIAANPDLTGCIPVDGGGAFVGPAIYTPASFTFEDSPSTIAIGGTAYLYIADGVYSAGDNWIVRTLTVAGFTELSMGGRLGTNTGSRISSTISDYVSPNGRWWASQTYAGGSLSQGGVFNPQFMWNTGYSPSRSDNGAPATFLHSANPQLAKFSSAGAIANNGVVASGFYPVYAPPYDAIATLYGLSGYTLLGSAAYDYYSERISPSGDAASWLAYPVGQDGPYVPVLWTSASGGLVDMDYPASAYDTSVSAIGNAGTIAVGYTTPDDSYDEERAIAWISGRYTVYGLNDDFRCCVKFA